MVNYQWRKQFNLSGAPRSWCYGERMQVPARCRRSVEGSVGYWERYGPGGKGRGLPCRQDAGAPSEVALGTGSGTVLVVRREDFRAGRMPALRRGSVGYWERYGPGGKGRGLPCRQDAGAPSKVALGTGSGTVLVVRREDLRAGRMPALRRR